MAERRMADRRLQVPSFALALASNSLSSLSTHQNNQAENRPNFAHADVFDACVVLVLCEPSMRPGPSERKLCETLEKGLNFNAFSTLRHSKESPLRLAQRQEDDSDADMRKKHRSWTHLGCNA